MANEPYVHLWTSPKINYRLVGKNGETLYATQQNFERINGVKRNLQAILAALNYQDSFKASFDVAVKFYRNRKSKKCLKEELWTL